MLERVVTGLGAGFDPEWGGFGPAPKFPRPTLVELCLRQARRGGTGAAHARHMAVRTLDAMAAGGIYDHLVGGFCRYSTDAHWLVPHFEKMLTDQALLARAYLHAWQDTGRQEYLGVVRETLDFVLRDLSTPEGALYSSFDADAGGIEGGHATFTLDRAAPAAPRRSGRTSRRVVRHHGAGQLGGAVHSGASRRRPARATARGRRGPGPPRRGPGPTSPTGSGRKGADRVERDGRGHAGGGRLGHGPGRLRSPGRGDRRLPVGLRVLEGAAHAQLAGREGTPPGRRCGLRLVGRCLCPPVRMDGQGTVAGAGALEAASQLVDLFSDDESGGFFTTGADAESLVVRPKEFIDGAVPATNSIAVAALLRANAFADDPGCDAGRGAHDRPGPAPPRPAPRGARRSGGGAAHVERAQRDRGDRATGRTCSPRCAGAGSPPPSSRGASPTTAPCSRGARPNPGWRTSVRLARVALRPRTP